MNVSRLVADVGQAAAPGGAAAPREKSGGKNPPEKPWRIVIKETVVDRYSVRFEDRATDPPVEIALDRLRLKAENIATGGKQRGRFSFATLYNRKGTVSLGGTFAVDPPSMNARIQVKDLQIGPWQPYFTEKVKILLTGGAISAEGGVSLDAPKGRPVRAGFRGEVSVTDFSSLDKAVGEEFLKFAALHFGGVEVGYNPASAAVREISLADFYSRIIVNPDGTLNVQGIVGKDGAGHDNAASQPAQALDNVRVETAEYPKYLARAYKVEKFPKPRNFIGMAKDLPVPEMEKLILTHIQVTDDDLRRLAVERASRVRDRLVDSGKVEPGRIFLVEPKTLPPERKEKLRDSRVDFRIR